MRLFAQHVVQARAFGNREWRACGDGIERRAWRDDGLAACGVLCQRWGEDRRALEDQAFGCADHAVDDGALKQLSAGADHQPAEAGEPAARVH